MKSLRPAVSKIEVAFLAVRSLSWMLTACVCISCGQKDVHRDDARPTEGTASQSPLSAEIIASIVSQRRMREAAARTLYPTFDATETELLSDSELDLSPFSSAPTARAFDSEVRPNRSGLPEPDEGERRYVIFQKSDADASPIEIDLPLDAAMPIPKISVDLERPLYPNVRVQALRQPDGRPANVFFEFDTSPSFDTPNFWQYPSLLPNNYRGGSSDFGDPHTQDLSSPAGVAVRALNSNQRRVPGTGSEIRFPFRVTAMRLPQHRDAIRFADFEMQARALSYGLAPDQTIADAYRWVRQVWFWGDDTRQRTPFETFKSGIGECAAINSMLGALLEMSGVRTRIVSGFNPRYRVFQPTGGHSGLEVYDATAKTWSYVDSFFDLYLPNSAVADLRANTWPGSLTAVPIARSDWRTSLGTNLSLADLFRYRIYGDYLTRQPQTSMLRLIASKGEANYGMDWSLNLAPRFDVATLFPERQKIFVRARYVFAPQRSVSYLGETPATSFPPGVRASPWAVTSFEIEPRKLMYAITPSPRDLAAPEGPCAADRPALAIEPPFRREEGNAFQIDVARVGAPDSASEPTRSTILLCEDDRVLGPAHSAHDDIRRLGSGRFSHWNGTFYFSASDNSDPNTNGHVYKIVARP